MSGPSLRRQRAIGAGFLLAAILALAAPDSSPAQVGRDSIPSTAYFAAARDYQDGNYVAALNAYLAESRGGVRTTTSRWIDSICYYAMAGECQYQLGQLADALTNFDRAIELYISSSDWLLRVQLPPVIEGDGAAVLPWGRSTRNSRPGLFANTYMMGQGRIDNSQVVRQGGVVQNPVLFPVHVTEIVRCTTLAMRRRRELLGPAGPHDQMTRDLASVLDRRPALANHWSQSWVEVQKGVVQSALGNSAQAVTHLQRGLLVQGELDHPLTGMAIVELGRLALEANDYDSAARMFEEASYAAAVFADYATLEEAFRLGATTHLIANHQEVYPPLVVAAGWARGRSRALQASLLTSAAENLAHLNDPAQAGALASEGRSVLGRAALAATQCGARLNHVLALIAFQTGNVKSGDAALAAALKFQTAGSLWTFQIGLVDRLLTSGKTLSDRVRSQLYAVVLRDPTPQDWLANPLECLSALTYQHEGAFERWFEIAAHDSGNHELALEVADQVRRHRFYSTLPLGGRLLALRWVLEAPPERLTEPARLQRQDLLARYPDFEKLSQRATAIKAELRDHPPADDDREAQQKLVAQLDALSALGAEQELILRQIAVRREPADFTFPPLRKTREIQAALPEGHRLLAFLQTDRQLHAFLFSREQYKMWSIPGPAGVQKKLAGLLRELGNFDANHQVAANDLQKDVWKKASADIVKQLFDKSGVDLSQPFQELIVVPDGMLWYLPFEALIVGKDEAARPLLEHVRVRYAPTAALALPLAAVDRPQANLTVVVGRIYPKDADKVAQAAYERLSSAAPRATIWPSGLGAAAVQYRLLVDDLLVLDDLKSVDPSSYDWAIGGERQKSAATLESWFELPWGGPEHVMLPGFHSAAESGFKKGAKDGRELFLATCGLMSTGARTVLLSRWRVGGQTSFDLTREFAQELAHTSAADAWQRSVQLLCDSQVDPTAEPRLRGVAAGAEPPAAKHPFFWAGYLVADLGRLAEGPTPTAPPVLDFKKKLEQAGAKGIKPAPKSDLPLLESPDALPPMPAQVEAPSGAPVGSDAGPEASSRQDNSAASDQPAASATPNRKPNKKPPKSTPKANRGQKTSEESGA